MSRYKESYPDKTRMHSSRNRTARSLLNGEGVSVQGEGSLSGDSLDRDPLDRDPLDRDPPRQRPSWTETPQTETLLDRDPLPMQWRTGSTHHTRMYPPPVNRQTSKKIVPYPKLRLGAVNMKTWNVNVKLLTTLNFVTLTLWRHTYV